MAERPRPRADRRVERRRRTSRCGRRCPSRPACATSSPSRATSRPAARLRGGSDPRVLVQGARLLLLEPGVDLRPGAPVRRPEATKMLDFELEIAAVIGGDGQIAGFTLMNDWSARDMQAGEMSVGLGPARRRTSPPASGPWLVTPDELPYADGRLNIEARVHVNGEELSRLPRGRAALHVAGARRAGGPRHPPARRRRARLGHAERRLPARAGPARRATASSSPATPCSIEAQGLGRLETRIA